MNSKKYFGTRTEKKLLITKSIMILFALFIFSSVAFVSAFSITTQDSNAPISTVSYELTIPNLAAYTDSYVDNATNATISLNTTYAVAYECNLNIKAENTNYNKTYYYNTSVYMSTQTDTAPIVNQTLDGPLADDTYAMSLYCDYSINKSIINTTISYPDINNQTKNNVTTEFTVSDSNKTYNKTLIVDTIAPSINLTSNEIIVNLTENQSNSTIIIPFTFATYDQNALQCDMDYGLDGTSNNASFNIISLGEAVSMMILNKTVYNITALQNFTANYSVHCADTVQNSNLQSKEFDIIIIPYLYANDSNMTNTTINNTGNNTNMSSNNTANNTNISETIYLNITLNKYGFSIGESGYYTINANNNSNVTLTVCPIASGWVQCYVTPSFTEESFPKTMAMPYSNKTGYYIIDAVMNYKNYTLRTNTTFEVINSVAADIATSKSSAPINTIITFNATASGGIAPYNYTWVMSDGSTFRGVGAYKNFTTAGTFKQYLFVTDSQSNKYNTSVTVIIKPYHTLTVTAIDKKTNAKIKDVLVKIDDQNKATDSNGQASFSLVEGSYDITASKENYGALVNDIILDEDIGIYMNMTFISLDPPRIELLTKNDEIFSKDSVALKFKAYDTTQLSCSLYVASANESWYALKDSGDNLAVDTEYTFNVNDLQYGAYKWKIECVDEYNNKNTSIENEFLIPEESAQNTLKLSGQTSDDINTALDNIYGLSGDEAVVVDAFHIKDSLKEILDRSERLDVDIRNLAYRRDLDENGRLEAQKNLTSYIENLKQNTPVNIKVTSSKMFVKYVKDDVLNSVLKDYMSIKNMNIQTAPFVEATKKLQSKTVISTKVMNVIFYYIDGNTREVTFVKKDLTSPNNSLDTLENSQTVSLLEYIPKTIAPDSGQINVLNQYYTIIKKDPLIEFPSDTQSIEYYFNKTISTDSLEALDTILVDKNIKTASSTTGFSIAAITGFDVTNISLDSRMLLIGVVILLILTYLIITFDLFGRFKGLFLGTSKKISYIKVLVNDALDYIDIGDYEKAAYLYREIKLNYESVNDDVRRNVFHECYTLCNKLDMLYFTELYNDIQINIQKLDFNSAVKSYDLLEKTYNKLDEEHRTELYTQLETAYSSLRTYLK